MGETIDIPWVPIMVSKILTQWTLPMCGVVILAMVLPPVLRWFWIWKTLRKMPGPSDLVPFRFLLVIYWSRRMYINVDYATAELFNVLVGASEIFKNQTFKFYNWMMPLVIIQTPEAVEVLLNSSENLKKPMMYNFLVPWLGEENVLTGTGDKWRLKRKLATPAFHFKTLEHFIGVFNEHGDAMVRKMAEMADKPESANIYRYVQRCTLDITAGKKHLLSSTTFISENSLQSCKLENGSFLILR